MLRLTDFTWYLNLPVGCGLSSQRPAYTVERDSTHVRAVVVLHPGVGSLGMRRLSILQESAFAGCMQLLKLRSCSWYVLVITGCLCRLCLTPPTTVMQRFVAGGVAGAISRTLVAPLERLRTMARLVHCSASCSCYPASVDRIKLTCCNPEVPRARRTHRTLLRALIVGSALRQMMADASNTTIRTTVQRMWADGALRGLWKGAVSAMRASVTAK